MLPCLSVHCAFFNHKIIRFNSLNLFDIKRRHQFLALLWRENLFMCLSSSDAEDTGERFCYENNCNFRIIIAQRFFCCHLKHIKTRRKRRQQGQRIASFKIESIFLLSVYIWMESFFWNFQSHRLRSKVFPLNSDKETTQITIYCLQMGMYHTISRCALRLTLSWRQAAIKACKDAHRSYI